MKADSLPPNMTKLVTPRAIRNYAAALGWIQVAGINGSINVFHRPDSELHQLIVPLDESFDDYGESVAEAIRKLAAFEHRGADRNAGPCLAAPFGRVSLQRDRPWNGGWNTSVPEGSGFP